MPSDLGIHIPSGPAAGPAVPSDLKRKIEQMLSQGSKGSVMTLRDLDLF